MEDGSIFADSIVNHEQLATADLVNTLLLYLTALAPSDDDEKYKHYALCKPALLRLYTEDPVGFTRVAKKIKAQLEISIDTIRRDIELLARAQRRAQQTTASPATGSGGSYVVVNSRPLPQISEEAMSALATKNNPQRLFARKRALVRVVQDEQGRSVIDTLSDPALRGELARSADFVRETDKGTTHVAPPSEVVQDVRSLGSWRQFPSLTNIITAPAVRTDGSIIYTPGYDPTTQLYYAPAPGFVLPPVPDYPDDTQLCDALQLIKEPFLEFPFDSEASRTNAFGLLFTPFLRPAFDGCIPLALVDKPLQGTGAGKYTDVIALLLSGGPAARMAVPGNEEEWRKQITATLLAGPSLIIIDNVEHPLSSTSLAVALTTATWRDRFLGRSEMIEVPQLATWIATGNNLRLKGDLPRRAYRIRIDAKVARPWLRTGWKYEKLEQWVAEQRGALLAALLTIIRGWYAAGQPTATVTPLGNFEAWAQTIGSILHFIGMSNFLGNLKEQYEEMDEDSGRWEAFLAAWWNYNKDQPVSTRDLYDQCYKDETRMQEALPEELIKIREKEATYRLGVA